ncbi:hypothetical protein [Streptomyces sp. NPDC048192]|uniref:hypothetical protein n=1 Tax=Streptomyces sp. NPDC048192 TaxID=3365510 RepID=UPI0037172539
MADEPEKTPITNVYAQQFASDLAANRQEQSDIATQITALQERLERLKVEEGLLLKLQGTLTGSTGAATGEASPAAEAPRKAPDADPASAGAVTAEPGTVPQPRQDNQGKGAAKKTAAKGRKTAQKAAGKEVPAKKAAASKTTAKKTTAKKATPAKTTAKRVPAQAATAEEAPATKAAAGKDAPAKKAADKEAPAKKAAGRKADGPTLQELILPLLTTAQGHPQTAREVFDAFKAKHPERATSVQVVRNNLELLVKNNRAEKSQQQGSVMYTALAEADASSAAGGEAGQAAVPAQAEKAAAQV